MAKTENQLATVKDKNYSIDKIKDMTAMSKVLKNHIVGHKLYTNISGKNYAHVEGWQFAGGLLGTYPRVTEVTNLSSGTEMKWLASVEIVNSKTQEVVGRGFAICSNKESKKAKFDEYAVLSMAQTRAIGKAYRNLVGWVMKLAGYESTPSEEMQKVDQTNAQPAVDTTGTPAKQGVDYIFKLNNGLEMMGYNSDAKKKEFVLMKANTPIKDWKAITQSQAQMLIAVLAKKGMEAKK